MEQVISKCPLLCLDTSLCKSLKMATIDTRTLTRQLVCFATLLDEVATETTSSGGSKPRRFLPSFKAARRKKAAAGQLLDVAKVLQVILSTLAKHQRSFHQKNESEQIMPTFHRDACGNMHEGVGGDCGDRHAQTGVNPFSTPDEDPGTHSEHALCQPATPSQHVALDGRKSDTPFAAVDEFVHSTSAAPISNAASHGPPPFVISGGDSRPRSQAVPPLQLSSMTTPVQVNSNSTESPGASIDSSSLGSDESQCSPRSCSAPMENRCRMRAMRLDCEMDGTPSQSRRPKCMSTFHQHGLVCDAVQEHAPLEFSKQTCSAPSLIQQSTHSRYGHGANLQSQSARESDGFFTARSHFSPPRSIQRPHDSCPSSQNVESHTCSSRMKNQSGVYTFEALAQRTLRMSACFFKGESATVGGSMDAERCRGKQACLHYYGNQVVTPQSAKVNVNFNAEEAKLSGRMQSETDHSARASLHALGTQIFDQLRCDGVRTESQVKTASCKCLKCRFLETRMY